MILIQEFEVHAPRQAIWDFLLDEKRSGACMPGVEQVERIDEQTYQVRLSVKVGPIKARFGGQVMIVETQPPDSLKVTADWKDGNTSSKALVAANVELQESSEGVVTCRLTADIGLTGVLAKYGQGVAQKKANEINAAFAECIRAALEPETVS